MATDLIRAAKAGNVEEVRAHLDQAKKWDENGMTALMYAVRSSQEMVSLLVEQESKMRDNNGWTALMHAVWHEKIETVKLLLCETQMATEQNHDIRGLIFPARVTALMLAACLGDVEAIKVLLPYEHGCFDENGHDALYYASQNAYSRTDGRLRPRGHPEAICLLERRPICRFDPLPRKLTPLIEAIIQDDVARVGSCLRVEVPSDEVDLGLKLAAERGYVEIAILLIPRASQRGIHHASERASLCGNEELGARLRERPEDSTGSSGVAPVIPVALSRPPSAPPSPPSSPSQPMPMEERPVRREDSSPSPVPPNQLQEPVSTRISFEEFPDLSFPDYTNLTLQERNRLRMYVIRYLSALTNERPLSE
ncbi:Ankyrin repeat protein 1 [Giardia muris]|uniref:Ankyrin repeat protein 1 n=1 Tax=Giardia muris TaxID=5742 RepID=A0A4Z1T8T7_GIAMU|nr:Ankyrin repeat protein 1 [Giardia muris]|eukprot:TNJ29547.1 Ankyrin repeat protein 1 [Giardia muris]